MLSTFGLLKTETEGQLRNWIDQLLDQKLLWIEHRDTFTLLRLTPGSWEVMRGERQIKLVRTTRLDKVKRAKADTVSWSGVDAGLFEALRGLRRQLADERHVPSYVVFSDATLREMARFKPTNLAALRQVHGVGEAKLATFGDAFLSCIRSYCRGNA
jgi:ATP-dependent DNA helicase RecQ